MSSFFKTFIKKGSALVNIIDILLLSIFKNRMFQLHVIRTTYQTQSKIGSREIISMLLKVKNPQLEIGYNTNQPVASKVAAIHKLLSTTGKVALLSFIVTLIFYTKFIEKRHVNINHFMTFYSKILLGLGLHKMKPHFENPKNCTHFRYRTYNTKSKTTFLYYI